MGKKILNLPNMLTISRIVLSPLFFILLLNNKMPAGLIVFVIVALTDLADGWVARRTRQKSTFGEIIDPMADKLMVLLAVIALILKFDFPVYGLLIFSRDVVSLLGSAVSYFKHEEVWKPNIFGKLTTAFQVITIICFIIKINFKSVILLFTIGLSVLAAITYFIALVKLSKKK